MSVPVSRLALLTLTALCVAPQIGHASPYLNWQSKTQGPAQAQAQPAQQAYNVPPSPYGQVGDPYRHTLNWPAKQGAAQQQASIEPLPQQALQAPPPRVVVAAPRPVPQPQPVVVAPISDPEDEVPAVAPAPVAPPVVARAPAKPAPAPVAATATVTTPDSGAYQVPATSKYAARIASARAIAAQQNADTAATPPQDAASPAGGAAPVPPVATTSLASQETDHVFIPGEQITDAVSQEPRRYSLHRQYGLRPDPIQVDHDASGALLETHFDAVESDDSPSAGDSGSDDGRTTNP